MRPRIQHIKPVQPSFGAEVYTIQGHKEIFFYKRVEAVLKTREVAIQKRTEIVILLNGTPFCRVQKTGSYSYVYEPSKDKKSSPELKELFRSKGIAVN